MNEEILTHIYELLPEKNYSNFHYLAIQKILHYYLLQQLFSSNPYLETNNHSMSKHDIIFFY